MAGTNTQNVKYVYDLPYFARKDLCRLLDQMEMWEILAGTYMGYDMMMIHDLRREEKRGVSPTDELLTLWGHKNHTILELFVLLSKMQHYQAMVILKDFVPSDYHRLIAFGEERLPLLSELKGGGAAAAGTDMKDLDVGSHNLNNSETNNSLQSKVTFPPNQNLEVKILNTGIPAAMDNKENMIPRCNGAVSPVVRENGLRLPPENQEQRRMSNASDASSAAENCGSVPHIDYKELVLATNNWNTQNILGKGGFGTVYKGDWKNTQVAVKRILQKGEESAESYQVQLKLSLRELQVLNSFRHDNILPLYGYSFNGEERCFIYQFMCNGSLEDRLLCRKGTEPLSWNQRHEIAKGTARGLQFLHNSTKPFIHGDIKSANILLDVNFIPRIGDFGLAREGPQDNLTHLKVSRVYGTRPYLPDEFLRGKQMSTKVDTFSFGIVLFELGTGLRAYDDSRQHKLLKEHVENCENLEIMIDNKIPKDISVFYQLMVLGKKCVIKLHRNRPEMEMVLKELEQPAPQCYSPRGPMSPPHSNRIASPIVYSPIPFQISNTPIMQPSSGTNRILAVPSHSFCPSPLPVALKEFVGVGPPGGTNGFLPIAVQEPSFRDIPLLNTGPSASAAAAAASVTGDMNKTENPGSEAMNFHMPLPDLSILGIKENGTSSMQSTSLVSKSDISTAESKSLDLFD